MGVFGSICPKTRSLRQTELPPEFSVFIVSRGEGLDDQLKLITKVSDG